MTREAPDEAPDQLGSRILRGSVWTAARQGVQQLAALLSLVVVARLVPPSEVGLFSMATLVLTITRALTETGFEQALIQRAELTERILDVGFTAVFLRALLVGAVMALGAPLFASFFDELRVADLLRVLALGIALEGLVNNRVAMLQRELDFRRYFFFHAAGQLVTLVVTVACAFVRHDVWAVAFGQLAGAGGRVLASYVLASRRPRLCFDLAIARDLLKYGRWVSVSSVLLFLLVNGDNLFIAKVIGATDLAYYNWAYQLANLPALFVTQILSSVMFPALASVRGDPARQSQLFVRSMRLTWLLSLPSTLFIAALVAPFTQAALGERWLPIVPITHALACFGLMRAVGASSAALFLAVGRPDLRAKLQVAQLVVFGLAVYPLYKHFGVLGVAWAVTLYALLNLTSAQLAFRLCELPFSALGRPVWAATVAALVGGVVAYLCAHVLAPWPWLALVLGSCAGVGVTLVGLYVLDRDGEITYVVRLLRRVAGSPR
ncbi:MAG: lipopolysaccharide biosynthesis protein [Polyangiales bacterium]